jgi:hypothetical protein
MNAIQYCFILENMGLNAAQAAELLGVPEAEAAAFSIGLPIPNTVNRFLRFLYAAGIDAAEVHRTID